MEVIIAVVRPKQNVCGQDYRAKLYDILLLDHKNIDKHGKPTKYLPAITFPIEDALRDEILTQLYNMTGSDLGGLKGERVLHIPWKKDKWRESLARFTMFCIPVSHRDKLSSAFVEKSSTVPGFYSLDSLLQALNSGTINFPPSTQTFVNHLESWLKDKHSKTGALDIIFRTRGEFRITLSVNNPVFLPLSMGLDRRKNLTEEIQPLQLAAHESLTKMLSVEKCDKVVINPLFGSGLTARKSRSKNMMWTPCPAPDYYSNTISRKSSLNSSVDMDTYSIHEREQYPLHIYASKGDVIKVQEYISRGYPLLKIDSYGWFPIHAAAYYGYSDVVQMLLDAGCSPNVVNTDERTPLHFAAMKGFPAVVSVLLNHPEIDMNVLDKKGRSALEMCKNKLSWEHIQVAKRLETAAEQPRQITVVMMDTSTKNLNLVDGANTTVHQLNQQMLREFNMPEMPYSDIFTIWLCSKSLELQLKPEHKPLEHMNNWKRRIIGMLTDGDPKQEEPHLKWRRNAKISLIVERGVTHPDGVNLLFHEARHNYINAMYPCQEQDVLLFASILLYMNHGRSERPTERYLTNNGNIQQLVPLPMLKIKSTSYWTSKILHQYKEFSNVMADCERIDGRPVSKFHLQNQFLNSCRNLTVYGSAFFTGSLQTGNSRQHVKCYIGVNDVGLHIINYQSRVMLHSYKYSEISWGLPPEYGILDVTVSRADKRSGDRHMGRNQLKLITRQAGMINHLMRKLSHITYGISYNEGRNLSLK